MSDKLRAAAQAALLALDSDDPTIQMRAALSLRAALAEPEQEYVCKCGLRVIQHQCKTDKEF